MLVRTLVSIFAIVLAIIVGGLLSFNMLNTQTEAMYKDLLAIEDSLQHESWDKAFKTFESLDKRWEKSKQTWPLLIDHMEIDSINMSLAELNAYIKSEEDGEALAKVYSLKILFKHIPEKETFTLKNIF